jgi:hypothetical protein
MNKTERKILWGFAFAGFLVPCALFVVMLIIHLRVGGDRVWMILIPWPTFPLLMSAEAGGGAIGEFVALLISALANALVYVLVGGIVAFLYRRFSFQPR